MTLISTSQWPNINDREHYYLVSKIPEINPCSLCLHSIRHWRPKFNQTSQTYTTFVRSWMMNHFVEDGTLVVSGSQESQTIWYISHTSHFMPSIMWPRHALLLCQGCLFGRIWSQWNCPFSGNVICGIKSDPVGGQGTFKQHMIFLVAMLTICQYKCDT